MTFRTRFAPSPTGPLHLGHAYSAILAHDMARAAGGAFLLRIDDIDQSRARPEWEDQIYDDLTWLGLTWDARPRRQSDCTPDYAAAAQRLTDMGLTYACSCTRRDIEAAASAPQEGVPEFGPDGRIYPGTCRDLNLPMTESTALRLDMARATTRTLPAFAETGPAHTGQHQLNAQDLTATIGDPILIRRQMAAAYHLAVVIDDMAQGITHVIRGADLFEATRIHVLLQSLLGLPTPIYHHHRLIRDETGKRLAKRDDARAIAKYRADGASPADIRRMVGL
ncbi:tRNA glutamyl-Q(34) synthetase GluQRS [Actibacterium sp. XHP0104]|uniref:tRNA glutamyl-Q(34) synthetase GluQRS n=1 Tax=Actibacterium sp. XHP0104 TaxID=2984335 RepID=UPI0021E85EB0|nr:tRNA glutamyl-Q(34) synthetase GluQRS [Actibacterium sp. XHP0104]MCV2881119.1 tRNA glutamyl-Q(34) synthetase GluQRS [Actibacterium sp. XHP0104]